MQSLVSSAIVLSVCLCLSVSLSVIIVLKLERPEYIVKPFYFSSTKYFVTVIACHSK